jgi:hypothetical protein
MGGGRRRDTRIEQERKRRRESSGTMSAGEGEVSLGTVNEQDETSEPMVMATDAGLTSGTNPQVTADVIWEFMRENACMIVQKIVTSPEWGECLSTQECGMRELEEENKELKRRLEVAEGALTRCEKSIRRLEEKVTDLTTRSMRDNIIIKNVEERSDEKNSDVEDMVAGILKTELKIPEAELNKIVVERAHRTGKQVSGRARNIVAKLNSRGKSVVMRHVKYISNTSKIRVVEQYPPEVHANREKLWPMFVEAKAQGKATRWNVDKLTIDGKMYNPPKDINRDINLDTTEAALKLKVKHTALTSKNNHHFQAHTVDIGTIDEVIPALKALCSDSTVAGSSHVMYAYRVGSAEHSISNWEDDGEWGAGKKIMEAIRNTDSYNILVCVTHWQGHSHLGPARFEIIKDVSNEAIQQTKFPM